MGRLLLFACLILVGCGGNNGGGANKSNGKLALTIAWPERGRLIPDAANSVKLVVLAGTDEVASKVVARPPAGSGTTSVLIDKLPPIDLILKASAHPQADGTGAAQANGTVSVAVTANATTSTSILMASTIHHVSLSPSVSTIAFHESKEFTATALDQANNMILTSPSRWTWETSNGNLGLDPDGNTCTVTGNAVGSATLTVRETESGKHLAKAMSVTSETGQNGYTIVSLCDLGGISYFGGLNDQGDAVGYFHNGWSFEAYVYRNGVAALLPTSSFPNVQSSQANGINNEGKIVGTVHSSVAGGVAVWHPDGTHHHVQHPGQSFALGITSQGKIYGVYRASSLDQYGPAMWTSDEAVPIVYGASNGGNSIAVNDEGLAASVHTQDIYYGQLHTVPPQILQGSGTLAPVVVRKMVGNKTVGNVGSQIAIWNGVTLTTIGSGWGEGINASGLVVGSTSDSKGFVWSSSTGFVDLLSKVPNPGGWTALFPQAINSNGQIGGVGTWNGQSRAFLLTPI
ncbi:MAG: hypothetical protein H7Y17_15990 [Chlorobia bacterium]|nr:hypothetical protein [Fimbriimonadaceae bacterium]